MIFKGLDSQKITGMFIALSLIEGRTGNRQRYSHEREKITEGKQNADRGKA